MKNNNFNTFTALAVTLCVPGLLTGLFFHQWLPYKLSGKHYLVFFLLYMLGGYLTLTVFSIKPALSDGLKACAKALTGLTLVLALTRMAQGLYNHKSIGFLVMLTLIHLIVLVFIFIRKQPAVPG